MTPLFDQRSLQEGFFELGRCAKIAGKIVEVAVNGGSALVLTLDSRIATRDVDAVFDQDKTWLAATAREIARKRGWDESWLNDGVKGWLSHADSEPSSKRLLKSYPSEEDPGLRVNVATPEYIFAMKCMAMRLGGTDDAKDRDDIKDLIGVIGLSGPEEALDLVAAFYPRNRILPKAQFGLEEIFEEIQAEDNARRCP